MGIAKVFHVLGMADQWTMSSKCFDGGGGLSAMDTIYDFRMNVSGRKKVEQIRETGAAYVAAACSNCKRQLTQLAEFHKMNCGVGGVHDLLSRAILIDAKAANRLPL